MYFLTCVYVAVAVLVTALLKPPENCMHPILIACWGPEPGWLVQFGRYSDPLRANQVLWKPEQFPCVLLIHPEIFRCLGNDLCMIAPRVVAGNDPFLEIQPTSGTISRQVGSTLVLTCKPHVEDPSLITQLEWRDPKNRRIESTSRSSPFYVQPLTGESGMLLLFSGLDENQAGTYTCMANYATSQQLQANATVSTFVDVTFVDAPESQYPLAGQDFLVKCKVHGDPAPIVEWSRNDNDIKTGDRYIIRHEGLLIKNVKESDDGIYKCTAVVLITGQIGVRTIKVEVIVPPEITPMSAISVIEGETAVTKCLATGKPPPKYTWIKESKSQDLSKTDRFDVKTLTGDLIINRVEFYDDDTYKCVAENQAGRAESKVKINVWVKPKIYELLNVTTPVNSEIRIICKVQGRPTPRVIFRKLSNKEPFVAGQQRQGDQRVILEQQFFEEKGESFGTLSIAKVNRSDDGLYQCIADNSAGTSYKNGHITVEFPPTFERTKNLPDAWSWPNKPGNLTCIPEAIPNATIIWKFNGLEIQSDSRNFQKIGNGPVSHLIVKPFQDPRFYNKFECVASNKHGTASIFLRLQEGKIPGFVTQVKARSITATTIKFDVQPPSYFEGLPIRSISVQFKREQDFSWDFAFNHTWSFRAPYFLENLIPETTYHFRFAARNDVGLGPWINGDTITMPRRSEPAEPKIIVPNHTIQDENSSTKHELIAVSPYADHFELRWNVPSNNGDPIDSYLIRYCVITKINGEWRDSDCSEEIRQSEQYTSYELTTLRPDTTYKIELRAHNAIGASSPAQIRVKTARGIDPAVPYNEASVTNVAIIGIVVAAIILVLIIVDLTCFCTNRAGILALLCNRNKSKQHEEEDPKLGSDEREPLKSDLNGEKNMSVEFDGKHVYAKSGEIIGKHSAV